MTGADALRVPLWWSPEGCSVYVDREGAAPHYIRMQDTALHALPADAVELGDVEALRAELEEVRGCLAREYACARDAEAERDALRADIRAVLAKWRQVPMIRRQILVQILQQVEDLLDREPGREESACTCAKGYSVCDSCRGKYYWPGVVQEQSRESQTSEWREGIFTDAEGARHTIQFRLRTLGEPGREEPVRELLGWEIPDHVDTYPNGSVICRHASHDEIGYPGLVVGVATPEDSERLGIWLRAHGHVVEHREDEGCGADGCTSFGGCAVCGPEAEFEADPEAHIAANDALLAGHVVEHEPDPSHCDTCGGPCRDESEETDEELAALTRPKAVAFSAATDPVGTFRDTGNASTFDESNPLAHVNRYFVKWAPPLDLDETHPWVAVNHEAGLQRMPNDLMNHYPVVSAVEVQRRLAHGHVVEHQPAQDSEPRVFFPGDTVPAEVATAVVGERMDGEGRHVFVMHEAGWPWRATHISVELLRPSPDEFDAIVDRARNARDDAVSASPVAKETGDA
ncbi:hypothetical protein ACWEOE_10785 [Amycolatopsis sp. NPDC004368]